MFYAHFFLVMQAQHKLKFTPRGVLQFSGDGDDWIGAKIKTQKNPWTKN